MPNERKPELTQKLFDTVKDLRSRGVSKADVEKLLESVQDKARWQWLSDAAAYL